VLSAIDRDAANPAADRDAIEVRIHTGTVDFAAPLSVPAALAFQAGIGRKRRADRLAALRNRWVDQVKSIPGIEVLTPADPTLHGGITSFRLAGKTSTADNVAFAGTLLYREGIASGACVRVTPALFNTVEDMDALAGAVRALA